jgi:hypothetical protein
MSGDECTFGRGFFDGKRYLEVIKKNVVEG